MREDPSAREFVRTLSPALRQAASIARALEGRVINRPKHGEGSDVKAALTIADTAAQEALLYAVAQGFPQVALEAEEDTPAARRFAKQSDWLVVIDPIDGTLRFYLEGLGPYAVMIGLARGRRYEAALVALPREQVFLDAVRGAGARAAGGETDASEARVEASGDVVFVSHDLPEACRERLRRHGLDAVPASGGAISVAPLVPGVRAGLRWVPNLPGGVSIRGRIGALIAAEAGARVLDAAGGPFPTDLDAPAPALVVAANDSDAELLLEALAAAGDPYMRS